MYFKEIKIKHLDGLHTRFSAMIVNKSSQIKNKYKINLYIKKPPYVDWLGISMLALLSLKVQCDESILIGAKEDDDNFKVAINELADYIDSNINASIHVMKQVDKFIQENTIANEQIFENLPVGIIVIDLNSNITNINNYALELIEKNVADVLGKKIKDIIPNSKLPNILKNNEKHFGHIQYINNKTTMVNRTPLVSNNKILGAIGVIQDVSSILGMKELNEKFKKMLESSHDMICFVDEFGKISYINPTYKKNFSPLSKDLIGADIMKISPNGLRAKVFKDKKRLENIIYNKDGIDLITTVEPIFIDNLFKGVMSTSKPVVEVKELIDKLRISEEEVKYYKEELLRHIPNQSFKDIIGSSCVFKDILNMCEKASKTISTVLIRGESGTGKELIAKAIHNNSNRKNNPFVRVNCAAIPENLLESELFGFEKGAFTGAIKNKPGKFAIADGGTIFLDEIGDMPISMQVKLLRVLQEKEIESLGGISPKKIDVRIIAATNRNLENLIIENKFREDLFYRLNVLSINLPPLKERKADIPMLVEHFIKKLNKLLSKNIIGINQECLNYLENYQWPGNIRELENIIERAINLTDGPYIISKDLPNYIKNIDYEDTDLINVFGKDLLPFEDYEKQIIKLAMEKYKSFNKAGKVLGLTHRTISLKCKKYNINKEDVQ